MDGIEAIPAELDALLREQEQQGFAGSVLVALERATLVDQACGLAARETATPNTTDTVFDIGSLTKQFTAAAILRLDQAGKLRVTDTIASLFHDVPGDKAGINLHHLLTHTAGLPDSLGDD